MEQHLPLGVATASYRIAPPLIKPSKLTVRDKGGVGKGLSDGWALNFLVGCTFGCRFCYVDEIHKKYGINRAGDVVLEEWGNYLAIPYNLEEAIERTDWERWRGVEVLLSSTHDPYLPIAHKWTRRILEKALPSGVHFCIQTRSPLVEKDFDLFKRYRQQVRLQVSIATYSRELSRVIEPRVPPPARRMDILRRAKAEGLTTGVIIAPVLPPVRLRPDVEGDLGEIFEELARIRPDRIYGECLHVRGVNMEYLEKALGERVVLSGFDWKAGQLFYRMLRKHSLSGEWWYEERRPRHAGYGSLRAEVG